MNGVKQLAEGRGVGPWSGGFCSCGLFGQSASSWQTQQELLLGRCGPQSAPVQLGWPRSRAWTPEGVACKDAICSVGRQFNWVSNVNGLSAAGSLGLTWMATAAQNCRPSTITTAYRFSCSAIALDYSVIKRKCRHQTRAFAASNNTISYPTFDDSKVMYIELNNGNQMNSDSEF